MDLVHEENLERNHKNLGGWPHLRLLVHLVLEVAEGAANFCATLARRLSVAPQRPRLLLRYAMQQKKTTKKKHENTHVTNSISAL